MVVACSALWFRPPLVAAGGMPTLQIQHARGVAVIEPDRKSRIVLNERFGVTSPDGSLVVTARLGFAGGAANSTISVRNAKTGSTRWETRVPGRWRPEAVRADGDRIILGDRDISSHHADVPAGRTATVLMFLERGQAPRLIRVAGNLVAEAFSTGGTQVVLIEHLPAERPTSYRVRPLDLPTGRLLPQQGGVKTANTSATASSTATSAATSNVVGVSNLEPTVMQGVRINQSWAATGKALYTLYDATSYGPTAATFVHALDLDKVTATCLAVPEAIDAGAAHGSVLSGDDNTIVVVGRKGIATIDAKTGTTRAVVMSERPGRPSLAASGASLWVASGDVLEQLNLATLEPVGRYPIPTGARGIVPLSYGPVTLLDSSGTIWFVGPGVAEPIKRGRVSLGTTGGVLLLFPPDGRS